MVPLSRLAKSELGYPNDMLRKTAALVVAAALGAGSAACGEDREGDVEFQGGTGTETTGTEATPTSPAGPTGTGESPGAAGTNTSP